MRQRFIGRRSPIVALVLVLLLAGSHPAQAQSPTAEARAKVIEGNGFFRAGRFQEALASYEAAFRLRELPRTLFDIAQSYRQLGDYDKAIFTYRTFLLSTPTGAPNRADAEGTIKELEGLIEKERAARKREPEGKLPRLLPSAGQVEQNAPGSSEPRGKSRRWYRRWYVWTIVGVVLVGAVTGAAVGATRGSR